MSRLHIMAGDGGNRFTVIAHAPVPATNNPVGLSWQTALKLAFSPVTQMQIGSGLGQIATAEANNVANGSVLEVAFSWDDDPTWDNTTRTANLTAAATDAVSRETARLQQVLRLFGKEIA